MQKAKVISPTECIITREDTEITVSPEGKQLYGIIFTQMKLNQSLLINNRTTFGDTIFDDVFNARQKRVKLKGKRTKIGTVHYPQKVILLQIMD